MMPIRSTSTGRTTESVIVISFSPGGRLICQSESGIIATIRCGRSFVNQRPTCDCSFSGLPVGLKWSWSTMSAFFFTSLPMPSGYGWEIPPGAQPPRLPPETAPRPSPWPRKPGTGSCLVLLPRLARDVEEEQRVVDDAVVARPELDAPDVLVLVQVERDRERAVDVAALGGHRVRFGHLDDEVGLAERPALRELRQRRQVLGVALGGACLDPLLRPSRSRRASCRRSPTKSPWPATASRAASGRCRSP